MPPKTKNRKPTASINKTERRAALYALLAPRHLAAFVSLLWPPVLALALYAAASALHLFSLLYWQAHIGAGLVLVLWLFRALRGTKGYWAHGTHGRFALLFIAFVAAGSCWGPFGAVDVRVWVTPPAYTTRPTVQLSSEHNDILAGSTLHVGYKGTKAVKVVFDGNEEVLEPADGDESTVSFPVGMQKNKRTLDLMMYRGWMRLGLWRPVVVPDAAPQIIWTEAPEITNRKTIRFAYETWDDFAVESVVVRVTPISLAAGQPGEPVELPLATPRIPKATGAGYVDLTSLPWAGQNVTVQMIAIDGAGQRTGSVAKTLVLPERKFRNPFARALIEERDKLAKDTGAAMRTEAANVMAGIARQQGLFKSDAALYLALRAGAVRLVLDAEDGAIAAARRTLWQAALSLEEGLLGQSREALARTAQDIAESLARGAEASALHPMLRALDLTAQIYFRALETERNRQPEGLREMNWLPVVGGEAVSAEDYYTRIADIAGLLADKQTAKATEHLLELQTITENLRTAAPELSPSQDRLAMQVATLRSLVRGQKQVIEETEKLETLTGKTEKDRTARREAYARALARQQALLSALQEMIEQNPDARAEIRDGVRAMIAALAALQGQQSGEARRQQAEAQALLENSALILSEKMRQSLTAEAP